MNEREQIKGITRLLEETHGICGNFSGCTNRKCSQCYAEALYNAGYRKLPEDSIVLSREESQALKKQIEYWEYETKVAREEIDNAGKETAKEILSRINEYSLDYNYDLKKEFEKLCKDYGVEVEECGAEEKE